MPQGESLYQILRHFSFLSWKVPNSLLPQTSTPYNRWENRKKHVTLWEWIEVCMDVIQFHVGHLTLGVCSNVPRDVDVRRCCAM